MNWYTFEKREPKVNHHILTELDNNTIVSGNMAMSAGGDKLFTPDQGEGLFYPEQINRWCEYPENTEQANEAEAAYLSNKEALEDRKLFVKNLISLLQQTREGVKDGFLDDNETVHVIYGKHCDKRVNVNMDSYWAIARDVLENAE